MQIALSSSHMFLIDIAYVISIVSYQCLRKDSIVFQKGHFCSPCSPNERQEGCLLPSAPFSPECLEPKHQKKFTIDSGIFQGDSLSPLLFLFFFGTAKQSALDQKGTYKYFGINEGDGIQHSKMKGHIRKEYYRRIRMVLKPGL